ncbi:Alpha N-terminal protein methyltransferase 1 [Psilocybe cubensis]|uniref:Alpha N-terminal protein methyltransferase 1 n=2 Tax=Psilocybe cubensis TaxID=181762 RepID=A0ACB8H8L9_PSICU|nr:Alpha N-terminal protein methyltransferase 1 [Psilocybe cubensis]KAH9484345.1 Alpha N-terminal protein methyltransferase 1 [Psilocybe cubensis]
MSLSAVEPNVQEGIEYWNTQPASLDGVLGGYGSGSLPRIDSLGSRLFLLNLFPQLSTIPSAFRPLDAPSDPPRTRALDVGAGIGRVTADVLLHLVSDVTILEPVEPFVQEALSRARRSAADPSSKDAWRGLADGSKSVTLLQGTLQDFHPLQPHHARFLDRVGYQPPRPDDEVGQGFDVIWCQWCLGHLSNVDLVAFLKRSHESLKKHPKALIVVKENICSDKPDGSAQEVFDEQDSSLTRSDAAWKAIFEQAGLRLVKEKVQEGLPDELFVVKMWVIISISKFMS